MRLQRLRAENFLSWGTLDFAFPAQGVVLLSGGNGAGKSNLVEAIRYVLTGACAKSRRPAELAGPAGDYFSVELETDAGTIFRASKTRSGRSRLEVDGSAGANVDETELALDQLLGGCAGILEGVAFFGASQDLAALADAPLKRILSGVVAVDLEGARAECSRLRDELVRKRGLCESALAVATALAEAAGRDLIDLDALAREEATRRAREGAALEARAAELATDAPDIEGGEAVAIAERALAKARSKRVKLPAPVADNEPARRNLHTERGKLLARIEALEDAERPPEGAVECPLCGAPIEADRVHGLEARRGREVIGARGALTLIDDEIDRLVADKRSNDARREKIALADQELARLEAEVRLASAKVAERAARVSGVRAEAARVAERLAALAREGEAMATRRAKAEEVAEAKIAAQQAAEKAVAEVVGKIPLAEYLLVLFGPGGLSGFILDCILPELNLAMARYARALSGERLTAAFQLTAETQKGEARERCWIDVANTSGAPGHALSSGGERVWVNVAAMLALADVARGLHGGAIDFLIFDEVFEKLDPESCVRLRDVLAKIGRERLVLVVTQNPAIKELFDTHFEVVRGAEGSRLVEVDR